jgi:hypothetical protein
MFEFMAMHEQNAISVVGIASFQIMIAWKIFPSVLVLA